MASDKPPRSAASRPKSILKKTSKQPAVLASLQDETPNRNYEVAVQRATELQAQKDIEAQILIAIESLLEYPQSSTDPSIPSVADTQAFQKAIELFRPQDYDDLIEERHAAGLCGYALCSRAPRSEKGRGKWKLGDTIIERKKYELWCSDECTKMAMFIRVQLDDTPAWMRGEYKPPPVKLLTARTPVEEEDKTRPATVILPIREKNEHKQDAYSHSVLVDTIAEKRVERPVVPPSEGAHDAVEGYTVGSKPERETLEDMLHG